MEEWVGVELESRGAALCFQILGPVSGTCGGKNHIIETLLHLEYGGREEIEGVIL